MSTDWRAGLGKFAIAITLGSVTVPCWESIVSAQIIPDETLGAESSVVTPDTIKGMESERISGGAVRGSNLFHSFREFNVGEGRGGYFGNPAAIENIFSRVTGSNPSEILGTLGVLGNANLFFLNPNGIIFGQNASLDIRGSFVGTTADSIVFPDGKQFSATNPDVPPLLTVNVQQPIGLQFEGQSGIITNAADLAVASRQTLSLSGSDVATTGNLTAPGGRVEVLGTNSVALLENATIDVSAPTGGGTVLIGGDFQGQGTVPNAQRTYVGDKVTINADALTNGNGGKVIVWADEVTGFYGSISARGGVESGNGGFVEVSGKEHLIFRGNVDTSAVNGLPGTLLLDPTNITIADGSGDEAGDGTDTFAGNNSGVVGAILTAPLSEIEDTAPTTIYESELEGLSGDTNIVLQATNDIRLQDLTDNGLKLGAGEGVIALSADADRDGVGDFVMEDNVTDTIFTNGRDIAISGASLTIGNINTSQLIQPIADSGSIMLTGSNGSISVSNLNAAGTSTGGAVTLNATGEINLNGIANASGNLGNGGDVSLSSQENINLNSGASIFSSGLLTGNVNLTTDSNISVVGGVIAGIISTNVPGSQGGDINFTGRSVFLTDGAQIATITSGAGNTGTIKINAPGTISLDGKNNRGFPTAIGSQVNPGAGGDGGEIEITTGSLSLNDGAFVSASTFGEGNAGAIRINVANIISLAGESSRGPSAINSQVNSEAIGNAGGIEITTGSLFLTDGAFVSAGTFGKGNGAPVKISATDIISLAGESSRGFESAISSQVNNSEAIGNAGGIEITTGSLFLTDGAFVSAGTFGKGNGAPVKISATDTISLAGESSRGFFSGIASQVEPGAVGNAGGIEITTGSLFVTDGAEISASTFGEGNAGAVKLSATDTISLSVESGRGISVISSQVQPSAVGNAGGIEITTGSLLLTDRSIISAGILGQGNAGNIKIKVTDTISLSARSSEGFVSIVSTVFPGAIGNAGEIEITTDSLSLTNSFISANNGGEGKAGDIVITANTLEATNGSQIQTNTITNFDAADITLEISDNFFLSGSDSGLFAQTGGAGDAGNIRINTPQLTIDQEASISAFTEATGNGGTITVNAPQAVLLTDNSKLTVETSGAGKPGDITITTPNLTIGKDAEISATATETSTNKEKGGSITVNASNLDLTGKLGIFAETQGVAPAGTLNIQPDNNEPNLDIQFTDTAIISASTSASGKGGDINITAPETINISGQGEIAVETTGLGDAGSINITTQQLNVSNQTEISASTSGTGSAGSITVLGTDSVLLDNSSISTTVNSGAIVDAAAEASNIEIQTSSLSLTNGASVSASTAGVGNAGDINLEAIETLSIDNSNVSSAVETGGVGNAGNVNLTAPSILVTDDSELSTSTAGEGDAGKVTVTASEKVSLSGSNVSSAIEPEGISKAPGTVEVTAPEISLSGGSALSSSTAGEGDAGKINITTEDLNLSNQTEISASTFSSGQGGDINITANNFNLTEGATVITNTANRGQAGDIQLKIRDDLNLVNSTITASTEPNSTGEGGSINIDPQTVTLTNSQIAVNSQGSGTGGEITLQADTLTLAEQSAITAETLSTDGGNIKITLGGNLVLRDESKISTTAGTEPAGGNGGKITIDASFIIAFPQEDSDITANAFEGDGGKITINAKGILGIEPRDEETPLSDITASSEFGQQGEVEINTSGIDPTRGLSNLPQETVEVEVAQGCQTTGGQSTLEFFAIGRGGLPPSPDDLFSSEIVITEWIPLDLAEEKLQEQILEGSFTEDEIKNMTLLTAFPCRK